MAFQFDPTGARPVDDNKPEAFNFDPTCATLAPESDGALARGWNRAKRSIATTSQLATGNTAGAAQTIKEADDYARANPGMQEGKELSQAWERGDGIIGGIKEVGKEIAKDWNEAPGIVGGLRATGRNLRAMGEGIVEQVPNMIAPVTGMVGGGIAGAAAGSAVPIVGNVAGGALGAFAGASAGNTLVEGGGMAQEAIQKAGIDPQDTAAVERFLAANGDKILGQSAVKGSIIGAVDTLTAGLGGRVLNAPARAAANRALTELGVDLTNQAAVKAAMSTPQFAAKIAGDAAYKAALSGAGNVARNAGVAALDPAGEFAGEFVGQGVATGDWDTKNAALEAFSSIGQSGIMFAGQKGYQALTRPNSDDSQARRNAEAAAADAWAKINEEPKPALMLENKPPDNLFIFPDGSVGRTGEMESYIANLPPEQQADARARFMGQLYTEINDPQARKDRRWWEGYREGQEPVARPDYLGEVQKAVAQGTEFTTQQTVEMVRNAMEDAWLTKNVVQDAPNADTVGAELQSEFDQAGEDAAIAANDARVRTSRILNGLQNILDAGVDNTVQAINRLNEGLRRINEPTLASDEMARVRRITDAFMGFRGVNEPAGLPSAPIRPRDVFADNSSMESLIPERPSVRMGINPSAGPLSKAAATAVDTGASPAINQGVPDAQTTQAPLARATAALSTAGTTTVEAAGPLSQPSGVDLVPQAIEAQQAAPSATQAGGQSAAIEPGTGAAPAAAPPVGRDVQATGVSNGTAAINDGAQANPQGTTQGQAQTSQTVVRPDGWRTSMLRAGPIAKGLGIDVRGKRLAQVLAEIDAVDGVTNAPVRNLRPTDGRAPGAENTAQNGPGQPTGSTAPAVSAGQRTGNTAAQPVPTVRQAVSDAGGAGESVAPVDPEQQRKDFREAEAKRTAPGDRARARAIEQNPLRAFLAKHGVSLDLASEWAPGQAERRAAMVQGYGPIFRKSGLQLDRLAQAAKEEGFLREADDNAMHALIDRAMRGERVAPMYAEGVADAEIDARIARQREIEEDQALAALDQTDDALAVDLADPDADIPWDTASSNASTEDAMRALGFSEQEIQDAVTQESSRTQESRPGRGGLDETTAREPQSRYAQASGTQRLESSRAPETSRVEDVQRDGYTRDLFGGAVDWSSRSESTQQEVRGNVQPATDVPGDTPAPTGDYRVRTIVGAQGERKLGASRIQSLADLAAATQYLYRSAVERFDGIVTDKDGKPLAVVGGFKGALSQTSVYPATIMGEAVRVPGAAHIWFSHNHPSGSSGLSRADMALEETMRDVFRGTGIRPMGLIAVGDGKFEGVTPAGVENGAIRKPLGDTRVPVIERELPDTTEASSLTVDSPSEAKRVAAAYYNRTKQPGIILLDAKLSVNAWVPLPSEMMGDLRETGQLRALYRAISESNAGAAILAHGGELDAIHPSASYITVGQNIGAALNKVDVRPLDIINANTGRSSAERGDNLAAGPVFSRNSPGMAPDLAAELLKLRPQPATKDSVQAAVRELVNGTGVLPNKLGRVVVATSSEIKSEWEPLIGPSGMEATADAGQAQGFYDPNTKTIFLIADHIKAGDEMGVVAHELMHKHGEAVLGKDGWDQLHGMIGSWSKAAAGSMERRVYEEAARRVEASRPKGANTETYSTQELFPYAVQVAMEQGIKPNLLAKPNTVEQWLGKVMAALRQVWAKITGKPDSFNSQDLVNLAYGIAQRENPAHAGELDQAIAPLRKATNFLQARMATKEFQGKELTNAITGMTAVVARNSLDKMLSAKAVKKSESPATHAMAVANADNLFERAILGWSKPDRSNDPNIRAIHRFFAQMDVSGRAKLVKLTVKESVREDRQNPLYTMEAVELNETLPGLEWLEAAAREDGVSLDEKNPLQRGVGRRDSQQAGPRATLTQPRDLTPGRSAEDVRSLAQDVERSNSRAQKGQKPQFSRAAAPNVGQPGSWDAPEPSRFDDWIYKMQDKHIDTKRVLESIEKSGKAIADAQNVRMQEELYHGRAAKRVQDFAENDLKPLLEYMRRNELGMGDVEEYLHARHAKEANALIAGREPSMPDGGSGMKNADADKYFASLAPDMRAKLEKAAAQVDRIIADTRELYAAYGLESQDTIDGWAKQFKHYVPLMREDKDGGMGIGQGFSIKGKEVKGRTGSTRKVVDILANIAAQREKVIVRGEKNRVALAAVALAEANPNKDFWTVDEVPTERVYDPKTNKVVDRPDTMFKQRDNVLVAKAVQPDGSVKERAIVFNQDDPRAVRMASALKNLDSQQLEGVLGVSAKITRYFAAVNTQWNPVFGVVNIVRDVQGAMVNLQSTPLAGKQATIAKDTLSALAGIYSDLRAQRSGKKANSSWSKLFEQFQEDGGQTGYRDQFTTSADRAESMQRVLDPASWMKSGVGRVITANGTLGAPMEQARKTLAPVFNWLTDYNDAMENAVRLSAYKAALDQGLSRQQAASVAKNLTVNFNRKGQAATHMGALYAFFNAAMQGTARIGQALFTMDGGDLKTLRLSKTGKQVVMGGMMLGALQALALSVAGFSDDDPPEFVRERSLIIPTGGKSYITIPMPLGLHVIPGIGRNAMEFFLSGGKDPAKRLVSMLGMFADAFNPIGNAGLSMQTLAPTALDPLAALTENKDWTGNPIARKSSNQAMPGHLQGKDTSTAIGRFLAEAINSLSGGNQYVAGVFSPTPDQIDYLGAQIGGGVWREASKVSQTAQTVFSGEELPPYKVPLLGRFYGNAKSQASQGTAFYASVQRLNALETEIKNMRKDGKWAEAAALQQSNPEGRLIEAANIAERRVQDLRRMKRNLIASGASKESVRRQEELITNEMARFNEMVVRASESRR